MPEFYKNVHEQVQQYFPGFDYNQPVDRALCDMSKPGNHVGHQQRAVTCYWAVRQCSPLDLGLDLGSTRGLTPYCIAVDKFARGEPHPHYLHTSQSPVWSDVIGDLADLSMFPRGAFPCVVSNHSLEHVDVRRFLPGHVPASPEVTVHRDAPSPERLAWIAAYPKWRDAYDEGVVRLLREEWLRVLRPGGILAMVVPDQAFCNILAADADHRHAFSHSDFVHRVLRHLGDVAEVVEFDTLHNKFSFNAILRRR